MSVAFIAIGDEVLRGETREANAALLAGHLQAHGSFLGRGFAVGHVLNSLRAFS